MGRRRSAALSLLVVVGLLVLAALAAHGDDAPTPLRPGRAAANHPLPHRSGRPLRGRERDMARAIDSALGRKSVVLRRGSRREREMALTFDDGPGPYTRAVLRVLRRARVRATFFPVGYLLDRWPRALAAEARAGHVVGDHTVNHRRLGDLPFPAQLREIRGQERRVRRHGLPAPRLVRPPYGSYDRATLRIARRLAMLVVLWTVDSRDYTRPGRRAIVRRVLAGARPGAIVLMHDGGGPRRQTVAALRTIIRVLRHRGFRLVTVPELLVRRPAAR